MPTHSDPYDFSDVPDNPAAEQRGVTPYDDEWKDHKNLTYLLLREGVPIEAINAVMGEIRTVEDLAAANAALFTLAGEHSIPRDWLVKQLDRKRSRAQVYSGETPMTWLKKAGPLDGPEMEHQLPTKKRPDLGGPLEGGEPAGPSGPEGALPGGPKPGMGAKPPMGAKPGMPPMGGPKAPGGKGPAGADEVKMLLDKGDLAAALEALKKLLPGGGDKSPAPPHRSPNLGKAPSEKKDEKPTPAKPAPKAAPEEGEGKPDEKEPKASYASLTWKGDCPTCKNPISIEASSDIEAEAE